MDVESRQLDGLDGINAEALWRALYEEKGGRREIPFDGSEAVVGDISTTFVEGWTESSSSAGAVPVLWPVRMVAAE